MKIAIWTVILGCMNLSLGGVQSSHGQSDEQRARELLEANKSALVVITVKGKVLTTTSGDPLPSPEKQRRTMGVTIADNGLIVASNSALDAAVGLEGQKAQVQDKIVTIKTARTEFIDIEISYNDSTTLKGKVVRQDLDADVVFIKPVVAEKAGEEARTFGKVDMSRFAASANTADQVVALSRSSSVFDYMPTLIMGRITGVYKKTRTFFVNTAGNSQGMPVFCLDGRPIGLTVVRMVNGQPSGILATLSAGTIQVMADQVTEGS